MGLHISRATLRKVGYDLILEASGQGQGATFLITPIKKKDEAADVD